MALQNHRSRDRRRASGRQRLGMEALEQRALMAVVIGGPDLLPESDSGISNRDNVTNVTTPTFLVRSPRAEGVTLFRVGDAEPLGTGTPGAQPGTWLVTSRSLEDGVHRIRAQADAGRLSRPLRIEINTAAAASAPTVDLCSCSDSGVRGDGITNSVAPRFSGTAPARSTVTLAVEGGDTLGTVRANARGRWVLRTQRDALPEGIHVIQATATDRAGNETGVGTTTLTIDRTKPTAAIEFTGLDSFRVTFSQPVSGFDQRLRGMYLAGQPTGERAFNLPLTSPRLRAYVGRVDLTPSVDGRVYDVYLPDFGPIAGEYTLRLSARASRLVDAVVGNPLAADASATMRVEG